MKVFNHGIHIILDVLTCGMWLPVHLILWACAPTVPIGIGFSAPTASANTTIVFGGPGSAPHVQQGGPGFPIQQPFPSQVLRPGAHHPPSPPAAQLPPPPAWAIEEARERLPHDAPWEVVASVAREYAEQRRQEPRFGEPPLPPSPPTLRLPE